MCGITGFIDLEAGRRLSTGSLHPEVLRHRGPDGAGEWTSADGRVGFCHRRLAVIELSEAGRQPMLRRGGRLAISFNGEIYNFKELRSELERFGQRFDTRSDTEVILAAYDQWGEQCVGRLHGMFAFALYDADREQVLFARDRAGEKPLFYTVQNGAVYFSSELKNLLATFPLERRVEPKALDCFLTFGYVPGALCILDGYMKLPAAHCAVISLRRKSVEIRRYWQLPQPEYGNEREGDLLGELDRLLDHAVQEQLTADVEVGVLLSGGLDSSVVTAYAARHSQRIKTFTVRFPADSRFDESARARATAAQFHTDHHELEGSMDGLSLMPELAAQYDEPIADSSQIPTTLVTNLVRKHCTVALGGDGGDEVFGGYNTYDFNLRVAAGAGRIPRPMRSFVARQYARWAPFGSKGRRFINALGTDFTRDLPVFPSIFDSAQRRRLWGCSPTGNDGAESVRRRRMPAITELTDRAMRFDFENYMCDDVLVKVDRASMLNSLEMRAPMLDARVVEFAFRKIPPELKVTASARKVLLRRLAEQTLGINGIPEEKRGFSIPLERWLRHPASNRMVHEVLLETDSPFSKPYLRGLLKNFNAGRKNAEAIYALAMLLLWARAYNVRLS